MRDFFIALTRNLVSLLGVAITTSSAVIILTLFVLGLLGLETNPYLGILTYLILPGVFLLGLALIPLGIVIQRRRSRRAAERGEPAHEFPVIDFNRDRTRRLALVFLILTAMNVVILATVTYKGVEVLDSARFCGTTCHVMAPENTAYHRSPHAGVKCVACHIGPGAGGFVKAKLSGTRQVLSVNLDRYPRPIPAPVEDLRPARETCGQCHWPAKFVSDQLKVVVHHADDEANTDAKTVLLLKVGGTKGYTSQGIHWHADPAVRIRYRSDAKRETIGEVELTGTDGKLKTFKRTPAAGTGPSVEPEKWRVMDCVDCHNRSGHAHQMPDDAVDVALDEGVLDRSLPYLRRESLRLLALGPPSYEAARQAIAQGLEAFYREHYPQVFESKGREIHAAGRVLGDIYRANVFPEMNVGWGTYPNHLGHTDSPGCFRCHDGEHKTADGEAISDDCATCHTVLALDEEKPEILSMLEP